MPTNNYGHAIDESDVAAYAENWQRCLNEDIPDLFYAFDQSEGMTERISSFRISGTTVADLLTATESFGTDFRFYIRLVLKPGYRDQEMIPETPFFYPLIQVASTNSRGLDNENAFIPDWDPNPKIDHSTDSNVDEIPGAGAYLFVENWLAEDHNDLADVFTLTASHNNQRVVSYKFSKDESQAFYNALDAVKSDTPQVSIHLGSSFVVASHPVAFRPVIEVASGSGRGQMLGKKTNAYFDFSNPTPPYPAGG
ncbi:hypothetical protein CEQ90_14360 [Lewinellaceae bacterium SD302]|nr:hypothetical protein CEQ90_14360 [Lewinellaceae bacterium SD302]